MLPDPIFDWVWDLSSYLFSIDSVFWATFSDVDYLLSLLLDVAVSVDLFLSLSIESLLFLKWAIFCLRRSVTDTLGDYSETILWLVFDCLPLNWTSLTDFLFRALFSPSTMLVPCACLFLGFLSSSEDMKLFNLRFIAVDLFYLVSSSALEAYAKGFFISNLSYATSVTKTKVDSSLRPSNKELISPISSCC